MLRKCFIVHVQTLCAAPSTCTISCGAHQILLLCNERCKPHSFSACLAPPNVCGTALLSFIWEDALSVSMSWVPDWYPWVTGLYHCGDRHTMLIIVNLQCARILAGPSASTAPLRYMHQSVGLNDRCRHLSTCLLPVDVDCNCVVECGPICQFPSSPRSLNTHG
jgi:hypothetical protein